MRALAQRLDPTIVQFHSTAYRNEQQIPDGPVLVVGGGNTGCQIAAELVRSHEVHLSVGARQTPLPQRILGRDLFTYLEALRPPPDPALAPADQRQESSASSAPCSRLGLRRDLRLKPRTHRSP